MTAAGRRHRSGAARVGRAALALLIALAPAAATHGAVLAPSTGASQSETERVLERRVKAAFLYRFTEFVTWPDTAFARADAPFTIVVVGRDSLADELRQITAARTVQGHPVEVRRVSEGEVVPAAQMMFIPDSEKGRLRDWLRQAPKQALVVTESEDALSHGSVINFILVEGRVRFEISLESAEKRSLRMSSRLLAIAQGVRTGNP
jgi:hypothetical protein